MFCFFLMLSFLHVLPTESVLIQKGMYAKKKNIETTNQLPERRNKGEIMLKCLDLVGSMALTALDLFGALLDSGYGASYGKISREMEKREDERARRAFEREREAKIRQRYYSMLYKLKNEGFLKTETRGQKEILVLTDKGRKKSKLLRKNTKREPLPRQTFTKESSATLVLVIFDIPERERRKRMWLRSALRRIGLTMIQKSVWAGKVKIPEELLDMLLDLQLTPFVEILEITKSGTLRALQ